MTKYLWHPPDFIKQSKGSLYSLFKIEAKIPIRTNVLRCPKCNSSGLDLLIENHFKGETEYIVECIVCNFKQRNPFVGGFGYLVESDRIKALSRENLIKYWWSQRKRYFGGR